VVNHRTPLDLATRWTFFGVPISNSLGWFLTNYIIFQLFAFYLSSQPVSGRVPADNSGIQWSVAYIVLTCGLISILPMGVLAFLAGRKASRTRAHALLSEKVAAN
jgi:uncharacterized membrane protein